MNPNQAEAGPSSPRTPPSTPPASAKSASRRKSWFGFVASPFAPASTQSSSPRRKSFAPDDDSEHELVDRSIGAKKEPGTPTTVGKRSSLQLRARDESQELLTIDGDVEASPSSRRKKRQSRNGGEGSGETVRLEDLSGGRRASLRSVIWASEDNASGEHDALLNQTIPYPEETRSPHLQPKISPSPPPKTDTPNLNNPIRVSPRNSSLFPEPPIPPDKSSPRLSAERPLPALPKYTRDSPPPPLTLIPTDIVITPSSPRKLQKSQSKSQTRRNTASMTDLRAPRAIDVNGQARPQTSGSASSSRSSSKVISRKSSIIGLGRPRGLKDKDGGMLPPPVPQKPQSVSSPHPSRSASPVPKISFAEPEGDEKERGRSEKRDGEGKNGKEKEKTKRARSLSGIFTRSISQPVPAKPGSVVNGSSESINGESEEILADQSETGKMAGVLEWLGVRKASSKRRLSENKMVGMEDVTVKRSSGESAQEINADSQDQIDQSTLRADPLTKVSSNTTITPKLVSGFTKSQPDNLAGIPSTPVPIAIPNHQSRFLSTESLPIPKPNDPSVASSQLDTLESYISSPTSEQEDFFTPPGAPWVDGIDSQRTPTTSVSSLGPDGGQTGRTRASSDASLTPTHLGTSQIHSSPSEANAETPSTFSARPKMTNRSNSGNSVIIEKMKGVFSISSRNRARSKSLLPQEKKISSEGDIDDFGIRSSGSGGTGILSTPGSSTTISQQWSPAQATNSSLLDLNLGRQVFADSPLASPRASFSQSTPPSAFIQSSIIAPTTGSPASVTPVTAKPARSRGRASTVSFASSAPLASFLTPPLPISPDLYPVGTGLTPPRRRPSAIKRFSSGLLGSSAPSSPKGSSLFPLPPRSSGSTFSSAGGGRHEDAVSNGTGATSQFVSPGASPRPSTGSGNGGWKVDVKVQEGETAAGWLDRMVGCVGRDDIAGVLASSGDELHSRALELYMAQFDFTHNALDIALRRLLMQISLPKETQQIDRVLEAFAKRYEVCEPGLFGSKDNTYVLAFSMMMLHTDVFNKNNKSKMSKADYVRNTRMEGVSPRILEAFYDNITYTPFVYVDLDSDVTSSNISTGGRSRSGSDALVSTPASSIFASPVTPNGNGLVSTTSSIFTPSVISSTPRRPQTPTTTSSLSTKQPDVYALINSNNLHPLRVDLARAVPPESPFSCIGTRPFLEMGKMQNAFVRAGILRIGGGANGAVVPSKKKAAGMKGRKGTESGDEGSGTMLGEGEVALRVTKVGTLSRKDDALDPARKISRKWKSWSVILTGSQLLFFKDPLWALTLQEQMKAESAQATRDERGQVLLPRVARFVPDEVFPVKDAVAVWDRSLTGNPYTFRFHLPHRAYLIQASDEYEINEWIGLINYAAAFKTANIRMRAGTMGRDQALLAGAAAASSLRRESRSLDAAGEEGPKGKKIFGSSTSTPHSDITPSTAPINIAKTSTPPSILTVRTLDDSQRRRTISSDRSTSSSPVSGKYVLDHIESGSAGMAVKDDGEQLGDIFNAVKAKLAAETGLVTVPVVNGNHPPGRMRTGMRVRIPSSQAVRSKAVEVSIRNLHSKKTTSQCNLDILLTQARNLAILTPFQRTTRDRVSTAVPPLAAKIREERLNIAKYEIWITILQCDLDKEEKEWEGMSGVALQGGRSHKVIKPIDGDLKLVEEGSRVRFEPAVTHSASEETVHKKEKVEEGEEGMEEILNDNNGFHDRLSNGIDIGSSDDGGISGSTSLGTTPQELPVLIRLPSEETTNQLHPTVSSQFQRPGMRRHASASNI